MRLHLLVPLAACVFVVGCGKSADDGPPVKPAVMDNPSGKPQTGQQVSQASLQQQAGENSKKQMADASKAMKEAESRTGGG